MADGWGGARPGSGRKKKLTTQIRELTIDQANGDAQYALGLMAVIMRDESQPMERRMAAGTVLMDRVWGKPAQTNKNEESGELVIRVERVPYGNKQDPITNTARGSAEDGG